MGNKKHYVLDTNILLEDPMSIFGFADNYVYITGTTLQELDSKKMSSGEVGYNARESCRIIEELRIWSGGTFLDGVEMKNGGKFFVLSNGISQTYLPNGYSIEKADNKIISACIDLQKKNVEDTVVLVTNDISMRINASVCNVTVETYKNDHISSEQIYNGRREIEVNYDIIEKVYKNFFTAKVYEDDETNTDLFDSLTENEFITLKASKQSVICIYHEGVIERINDKNFEKLSISPKNVAQRYALYALLAPVEKIPVVILKGSAGTAKTFLSLAAAVDRQIHGEYDRIYITRSNVTADHDFGFLPGTIDDKMEELIMPFHDNLEMILKGRDVKKPIEQVRTKVNEYFEKGIINVLPLSYIRGRSICNSYIIVDEAQNMTRSLARDVITRVGKGTKLVILGDPSQVDNHILDSKNNGLIYLADKMKGSKMCAQLTFTENESVRSALATEALKRL